MRAAVPLCAAVLLVGCGTVGEPLYPALNIPMRIGDLTAVERGDKIDIRFTIPPHTTEGLLVKQLGSLELRIGPGGATDFQVDAWAASAKRIEAPVPAELGSVHVETSARELIGKEVLLAVRAVNAKGRMSEWSNIVILNVEQPLAMPVDLHAEPVAEGVRLTWSAPDEKTFRIYRKTGAAKDPALLATSEKPEYVDTATEYGKTYEYYVQGIHDKTESDVAGPQAVTPKDIFPPRVPTRLTASLGVGAIELTWDRNTEPDFKEYRVYRSQEGGPFLIAAEGLEAPSYSDRKVESGMHYRYRVTAQDQSGNESKPSESIEAIAP